MRLLCKLCLLAAFFVLAPPEVLAQTIAKGQVFDSTGEPVIGATVVEKGDPKNAAVTDFDGNFTLTLKKAKSVVISYIGMVQQEVTASQNMSVTLQDDNASLEEVVVVGYTSKARKDLTGSVGSVSGAKLAVVPVTSAAVALQGKISGVQVTTVDGQPGADVNIRVRGGTSVTQSNSPLYIVDGFQVDNINDIPPTDIASIDVLKDASLTAIYGAKGGNGVVIVTTKAAKEGQVKVSFNGSLSISHISKTLELMNPQQFANYQYQWHAAAGTRNSNAKFFKANFGNPYDLDMYSTLPNRDWQDEVMGETPLNYSTNVTIGGGSEKVKFNFSLTQSEDKGIILGSGVRRTILNMKTNVQVTKNFSVQFNPKFTFRRDEGAGGEHVGTGGIIDVLQYRPTNGLREYGYIDPSYADPDEEQLFEYTNPKNDIATNQLIKHSYTYTNGIALEWKPIKGLNLRSEATIGLRWIDQSRFYGALTSTGQSTVHNKMPVATITNSKRLRYIWTNTAAYSFTAADKHNWSFLLGQEISDLQDRDNGMTNHFFPRSFTAQEAWNNMGFGTPYEALTSLSTPNRTASFFGQASYNFQHKYLLSATFRADGSTKFAPGKQWGYFPSISGAWVVSEEPFMKNVKWINQLKIRAALGLSGNNNINDDMWRQLYSISSTGGPGFGETTVNGEKYYSLPSSAPNPDIKWESTITRNLAADIQLFNGRITITPEFYWNTTRDLLYSTGLNSTVGYGTQMQNIGQVTNKGIEFAISGDILQGKDYVLSANVNFGWNRKIIDKLDGGESFKPYEGSVRWQTKNMYDYYLRVGDEVGLIYGFVYDGLYGFDEFYYDPLNNYQAMPWGSAAADNGTSKNQAPREDGYVTVINDVSGTSNSGIATMPGKVKFKDLNGDGRVDENDRTVIGNTNPKIQGGFGLSGQWKDFDFTANFTYMLDFDVNNATAYALSSSEGNKNNFHNVLAKFADGWQYNDIDGSITGTKGDILYKMYYHSEKNAVDIYKEGNPNRTLWNPADVGSKICNSYFIEDGSFLRCNDVTIGYTLPKKLTSKVGVSKARFYLSASNLFIITGYTGYDPEVDIQTGLACGIDYNRYPRSRSFVFGTNITF